jgi:hypothetical protein
LSSSDWARISSLSACISAFLCRRVRPSAAEGLGLPATFIEQREIAFGGLDVCQVQPERADQGGQKSVLVGRQPACRCQFDDRQRLVLMGDRVEHEFLGRKLGQPVAISIRPPGTGDRITGWPSRAHWPTSDFAGREAVLRLAAPRQSLRAGTLVVAVGVAQKE